MWGASITGKTYGKDGVLRIQVTFSKQGADPIIEMIDMTGGSEDVLDIKIKARLQTLNTTDELVTSIKTGVYTPKESTATDRDLFFVAYRKLERLEHAAVLGIIDRKGPEYIAAQQEAKSLFSYDFVDVL